MTINLITTFFRTIKRLTIGSFARYQGESQCAFTQEQGNWRFAAFSRQRYRPLVVVGRQYYSEYAQTFPITNLRELRQVLALQYGDDSCVLHYVHPSSGHQRMVQSFVLSADFANTVSKPAILLPESFLLRYSLSTTEAAEVNNGSVSYFISGAKVAPLSQLKSALCPDKATYRLSSGIASTTEVIDISSDTLANQLVNAMAHAPWRDMLTSFWFWPKATVSAGVNSKKAAVAIAALALAYLGLSTAYLRYAVSDRQQSIEALAPNVNALLNKQELIEAQAERLEQLQQALEKKALYSPLWLVVQDMMSDKSTEVNGINLANGEVIVRGTAQRATDVLAKISTSEFVASARFLSPVSRARNNEVFTIAFSLKQSSAANNTGGGQHE